MDNFQYTITSKKIDNFKTIKEKVAFLREMDELLDRDRFKSIEPKEFDSISNAYKCSTKVLRLWPEIKSKCPHFIKRTIRAVNTVIATYICNNNVDYKTMVDTFQFTDNVYLESNDGSGVLSIAKIVADKSIPFNLNHNMYIKSTFNYLLDDLYRKYNKDYILSVTRTILQLEDMKRQLPSAIKYTILEDMLTDSYASLAEATDKVPFIEDAITRTQDFVEITNIVSKRIKET